MSEFSRLHPVLPQRYVQEYKTDMKNRKAIEKVVILLIHALTDVLLFDTCCICRRTYQMVLFIKVAGLAL